MLFYFPSIAYQAKAELATVGIQLSHSHVLEVCSALCGYASYSAYASTGRAQALDDAEHVVLDPAYAQARAVQLGISATEAATIAAIVAEHMKLSSQSVDPPPLPNVYTSVDDFRDNYLYEHIQSTVLQSGEMSSTIAVTNATGFEVYSDDVTWDEGVRESRDGWTIEGEGTFSGEQDEDRVYHGHEGNFTIRIDFDKVDRVGLREVGVEVTAGLIDSYEED
jgi:hypothetical protein